MGEVVQLRRPAQKLDQLDTERLYGLLKGILHEMIQRGCGQLSIESFEGEFCAAEDHAGATMHVDMGTEWYAIYWGDDGA